MNLAALNQHLRETKGVRHKLDIQRARASLGESAVAVGDDCAAIPYGDGFLLLAIEGLLDAFVQAEPWFAGYCAVMVNVSDVASMGGRPIAIVDAIWTESDAPAKPIWDGMSAASLKYGVPIVGGHTNHRAASAHLAASVLGTANRLLTSFAARPCDALICAIDLRGQWFGEYPYWNASTNAPAERLRGDLQIFPELAERGLCHACKDVSMAGLVGTAAMLAESSGVGFTLNISAVPAPPGTACEKWLTAFPSYGYLLAAPADRAAQACRRFDDRGIAAAVIGTFDDTRQCVLTDSGGGRVLFWDLVAEPFTGFGPSSNAP